MIELCTWQMTDCPWHFYRVREIKFWVSSIFQIICLHFLFFWIVSLLGEFFYNSISDFLYRAFYFSSIRTTYCWFPFFVFEISKNYLYKTVFIFFFLNIWLSRLVTIGYCFAIYNLFWGLISLRIVPRPTFIHTHPRLTFIFSLKSLTEKKGKSPKNCWVW